MKRTFLTAALVAVVGIMGLSAGDASAQDAKAIYAKECAKCHGDSGAGDGAMGQKLKDKPSDWTKGAGLSGLDDAKLAESIAKGGGAIGKSKAMPAYPKLSDAEVKALVAHVKSLKK
ncbi:MAG: cytochrome c [Candidatus Rokubacteria bacterium]|nr:cytochrome c [Candidatus Rokubacteria bacterium]